jgi:hypothetical protein
LFEEPPVLNSWKRKLRLYCPINRRFWPVRRFLQILLAGTTKINKTGSKNVLTVEKKNIKAIDNGWFILS